MIMLESNCRLVMTDSGGVQKEAYFFEKPAIILRSETEWTEIVDAGAGIIADADQQQITAAFNRFSANRDQITYPKIFGDGFAAEFICETILEN
jgi:UDP-GlcNAc3NAcA epimerase